MTEHAASDRPDEMTRRRAGRRDESPPRPPLDLREHRGLALGGAAALVLVVVGLVLAFGVKRPPDWPTVAEQPQPALTTDLAVQRYEADQVCTEVIRGDGDRVELGCDASSYLDDIRWVSPDIIEITVASGRQGAWTTVRVDISTGERTRIRTTELSADGRPPDPPPRQDQSTYEGRGLWIDDVDGTTRVQVDEPDGTTTTLFETDTPDGYWIHDARWSGDGRWVVLSDSVDRIVVLPVDPAEGGPRVWATDVRGIHAVR